MQTVEQMEMTLREKQREVKQQITEIDLLKHRLDQKTQVRPNSSILIHVFIIEPHCGTQLQGLRFDPERDLPSA